MSSFSNTQMSRKNLPHLVSNLKSLDPEPVLAGLFKFVNKQQVGVVPGSHRYHQLQPLTTVNPSAFTNTNYYIDFNLPMNVDQIDEEILEVTLKNNQVADTWTANASVPFWFQRIEIRHDVEIKQTLRDIHMYLDQTMYQNDFDRDKLVPLNGINASTYKADATTLTIQANSTATYRLRLNSIITRCNLFVRALRGQVVVRIYPQAISTFSNSARNADITLEQATLLVRELNLTPDATARLEAIHRSNVDYRFVDVIHEETNLNLTSGATFKYVTNNFHDTLYSHLVVLTRDSNPTLGDLEVFLRHSKVFIEDVAGQNLSNGIQWTDELLRKVVYTSNFPNTMALQTDMNVYVPKSPSVNPETSYKRGLNNGYDILPRNAKLCIVPSATAQVKVDILCYAYLHLRVENGKINIY